MITDDPGTPGNNHWEINLLPEYEHTRGVSLYETPNVDVNYGLGSRIQLRFEVPWVIRKDDGESARSGLGNSGFGVKWRFLDDTTHRFFMSIYPALEFNNRTHSVARGLADPGRKLFLPVEAVKELGVFSVNGEVGLLIEDQGDDEWAYGIVLGRDYSEHVELMGELRGSSTRDFSERELILNVGSRVGLGTHTTLLVSAGRSIQHSDEGPMTIGALGLQFFF
jgi:hypothetical protein